MLVKVLHNKVANLLTSRSSQVMSMISLNLNAASQKWTFDEVVAPLSNILIKIGCCFKRVALVGALAMHRPGPHQWHYSTILKETSAIHSTAIMSPFCTSTDDLRLAWYHQSHASVAVDQVVELACKLFLEHVKQFIVKEENLE